MLRATLNRWRLCGRINLSRAPASPSAVLYASAPLKHTQPSAAAAVCTHDSLLLLPIGWEARAKGYSQQFGWWSPRAIAQRRRHAIWVSRNRHWCTGVRQPRPASAVQAAARRLRRSRWTCRDCGRKTEGVTRQISLQKEKPWLNLSLRPTCLTMTGGRTPAQSQGYGGGPGFGTWTKATFQAEFLVRVGPDFDTARFSCIRSCGSE